MCGDFGLKLSGLLRCLSCRYSYCRTSLALTWIRLDYLEVQRERLVCPSQWIMPNSYLIYFRKTNLIHGSHWKYDGIRYNAHTCLGSSVGRAFPWRGRGRRFEPAPKHQIQKAPQGAISVLGCLGSKAPARFTCGLERRRHVALRQSSRGQEHLVDYERSEIIYLVIRDRARPQAQCVKIKLWVLIHFHP